MPYVTPTVERTIGMLNALAVLARRERFHGTGRGEISPVAKIWIASGPQRERR
jgi:purine nucleoside phosphorylase